MPTQENDSVLIGLDFGTTNSVAAIVLPDGNVETLTFHWNDEEAETFRSVLYAGHKQARSPAPTFIAGPMAIDEYLNAEVKGRLIQSIKSLAASRSFHSTSIHGRSYTFEALAAAIIRSLLEAVNLKGKRVHAVVGRPVHFVSATSAEDEQLGLHRISNAVRAAGVSEVHFELEPVAAAHSYEADTAREEVVLIADFGGGTSDFSLLKISAGASGNRSVLGSAGVPIAGDTFDGRIVRQLVSPMLGKTGTFSSLGKTFPMPAWIYTSLQRWHHLSFLKTRDTLNLIRGLIPQAADPGPIRALLSLIDNDLGFELHKAVQKTKLELSHAHQSTFLFAEGDCHLERVVRRDEFEAWIAPDLHAIRSCVTDLLESSGINASDVSRVFLTGGTSLVPAVNQIFADLFDRERLTYGDRFTSVAQGLARSARLRTARSDKR